MPYKYRTKQKKNSVRVISNAVLVRSEADSNRCRRFCRPVTKPLIHRTIFRQTGAHRNAHLPICECKYTKKN